MHTHVGNMCEFVQKNQEMMFDALNEELKKKNKSTTGTFVRSFDDVLGWSKSIDGVTSDETMWQLSHGVFDNEEATKEFLDETSTLWGIDFNNEDSYRFVISLFNCALKCERRKINSENNKAHGKVTPKQ